MSEFVEVAKQLKRICKAHRKPIPSDIAEKLGVEAVRMEGV